jgi:hypothetical protein
MAGKSSHRQVRDSLITTVEQLDLWTAEGIGGVFPASRVREIRDAPDALTQTEKRVYDVFWGSKHPSPDRERIVKKGYDRAAKEAGVTKRNIAHIIQRLIDKGFLQLVAPPIIHGQRIPTTYRVLGYPAVREDQRRKKRNWVIRTGSGISYARRIIFKTGDASPKTTIVSGN